MGTKLNPGRYDCYDAAVDDEPLFTLLARDALAPALVELWAWMRQREIGLGAQPQSDLAKVQEARRCAADMRAWHRKRQREAAALASSIRKGE